MQQLQVVALKILAHKINFFVLTVEHGANDIVAHDCVVPGDLFAMLHMPSIYLIAVADNSRGEQYARIDAHGGLCIPSQLLALHACELICAVSVYTPRRTRHRDDAAPGAHRRRLKACRRACRQP